MQSFENVSMAFENFDYVIYADGASLNNPGPAGFGVLIISKNGEIFETSDKIYHATNNQAELSAVITGLSVLPRNSSVLVRTDSEYIVKAFNNGWLDKWQKNGWKTANKRLVQNKDRWERLLNETSNLKVVFEWVKGHHDDAFNLEVDRIAVLQANKAKSELNLNLER
ncbi:MAG: ribonuclease HI [Deltaproteobacteria bacterium]|nr:ribonuclease HI [Deltaproteobacteria bacterium]